MKFRKKTQREEKTLNPVKYHAGHGLVDKAVVIVFSVPDQSGMAAKNAHFRQIFRRSA